MMAQVLRLKLRGQSYPVYIGNNIIKNLGQLLKKHEVDPKSTKLFVISDKSLTSQRKDLLHSLNKARWRYHEIPVKAGEGLKGQRAAFKIYDELLKHKGDRQSLILALGGGTVGDVAGFIASTFMRGIDWIGIPTTFLSQVDSSVGGKTGINHPSGKNLIGTFHQPKIVICETSYLRTLSPRERISGLGEVIKYSLTYDSNLFHYLKKNLCYARDLDPDVLTVIIKRSLQWKMTAVERDEKDIKGIREVLNFGHTFGHALETITAFKKYKHGEAVLWGMRFALCLSVIKMGLREEDFMKINSLLMELKIPPLPGHLDFNEMVRLMKKDKKSLKSETRFILLERIGKPVVGIKVSEKDLKEAFGMIKRKSV